MPVEKDTDQNNTIFSGTNVVSRFGQFLVTTIGLETEFGRIAQRIARPETENAFEKGTKSFGFLIIRVIALN